MFGEREGSGDVGLWGVRGYLEAYREFALSKFSLVQFCLYSDYFAEESSKNKKNKKK